jgi:RNA polymerase sigma-70 factor (ECF subfamily)
MYNMPFMEGDTTMFADEELMAQTASRSEEVLQVTDLVAAARSGSSAAFAELREIYGQRVYGKLLTITRNKEDAEDALQETFLRAYMALERFEGRSTFYTWITTIAINSALMILRRRRRLAEVSFDSAGEAEDSIPAFQFEDTRPSPEHVCGYRQRHASLLRSMSRLQPPLRQAIEMRIMGERSIREIAQALAISEVAVKSRLSRARARLTSEQTSRNPRRTPHASGRMQSSGDGSIEGRRLRKA